MSPPKNQGLPTKFFKKAFREFLKHPTFEGHALTPNYF